MPGATIPHIRLISRAAPRRAVRSRRPRETWKARWSFTSKDFAKTVFQFRRPRRSRGTSRSRNRSSAPTKKPRFPRGFRFRPTGLLRAERLSAAAAAGRLRVRHREPGAAEVLAVIQSRAAQVRSALRVHDDFDAAGREHVVVLALLVELEPVLEPGAAAALHEDAKGLALGVGHRLGKILDLLHRRVGQREERLL